MRIGGANGVAYTSTVTGYDDHGQISGSTMQIPDNVPAALKPLAGTYGSTTSYNPISGSISDLVRLATGEPITTSS